MEKELFDYVSERVDILSEAPSSKQETKEAALAWREAVAANDDPDSIDAATTKLIDFLEGRPNTVDNVILFAQGPAKDMFGEEAAAAMLERQLARKEQGEKYCDCDACSAASQLLMKFGRI